MATPRAIFWFRRDLRLADNPALLAAAQRGDGDVTALFIVDDTFARPAGTTRVEFLRRTLDSLDVSLGGRLNVLVGDPVEVLTRVARDVGARLVVATDDFGPRGRQRDRRVQEVLANRGISVEFVDSPYAVKPGTILSKSGTPYQVFSAFRRSWELEATTAPLTSPSAVSWRATESVTLDELSSRAASSRPAYFGDLPDAKAAVTIEAGEPAAQRQLTRFASSVDDYQGSRDFPGVEGTSHLSAYLRFGSLHPRQVLWELSGDAEGRRTFRAEIGWREFYADVMLHRPDSAYRVMQKSLEHLRVDDDARAVERFAVWAKGETGFPLVDAGMRQLLSEGWMHNRVRMVCASFLVKHLHLDWRWGARWFMWRLVDADLASNQHGWQWTAGTGTDAAPFERIFNPTLQAQRFDPRGEYVRRYVPELATVPVPDCLLPGGGAGLLSASYASPMLDALAERREALARFAQARDLARIRS
ncbi:MAG: deoxyribodipyrimidine photo-lyase [Acidimicrobiaceae bacterium]|nr:deoxyribodipyrimidine photo-lyase [Acidimicrobiaceae bacterium]